MDNLTEIERKVLEMLFSMANIMIKTQNDYIDIDYQSFGRDDLYNLAEKLGIEYD